MAYPARIEAQVQFLLPTSDGFQPPITPALVDVVHFLDSVGPVFTHSNIVSLIYTFF